MAFTKITNAGFGLTTGTLVGVAASFSSTVSVGGTLTYEDVTNVDSVGLITARNGIEVTDKGVQVGTGATVDSAADNTLTFLTNGSERLRITSAGNIGINETSPTRKLHAKADGAPVARFERDTNDGEIIEVRDFNNNQIGGFGSDTGDLTLSATNSNNLRIESGGSERLRITSAGNIGIDGTTAPRAKFDFGSGTGNGTLDQTISNYQAVFESPQGTGNYSRNIGFAVGTNGIGAAINAVDNGGNDATGLIFATGTAGSIAERLRIDSSGRLLLGTTTEGAANADNLTIADSGHAGITIRSGTSSKGAVFFSDATSGSGEYEGVIEYQHSNNDMLFFTSGSEAIRIDSSGQVGIKTASPVTDFELSRTGNNADGLTLTCSDHTNSPRLFFKSTTSNGTPTIFAEDGDLRFNTGGTAGSSSGTERMRIDSSGDVGISGNMGVGTNSPESRLEISRSTADDNTDLRIKNYRPGIRFVDISSSTSDGEIVMDGGALRFRISEESDASTALTERMRIDSSGRLLLNHTSSINNAGVASQQQITGDSAATASLSIRRDANSTSGPLIIFGKSRSGALGNNVSVAQNDNIGSIVFAAADGTDVSSQCAEIKAQIDGTPGSNDTPGRLIFMTASDGSNAPTERLRINSSGQVHIGQTSATSVLGNGVSIKSGSTGSAYNTGALSLTGAGGDFYGVTFNNTGASNSQGFGFLAVFSGATDSLRVGYNSGSTNTTVAYFYQNGNFTVAGALSKGSGSFRIDHPLPAKTETHDLVHSFIEGPQADLIYRGKVDLVAGAATVNLDTAARMTEGTFVLLNTNVQCFTTNESDWTAVRGSVSGNTLTIAAEDNTSTATVSWLVIGERQDQHMIDTDWTDDNGRVITEPEKPS